MRIALPHPILALLAMLLAIVISAVDPSAARADSADEAGRQIATDARERQKGFGNFTANLTMTLRNKRGQESQRELRLKVIEIEGDGDRTLFVFDRPRDVRGTAFLIHAHKDEPDEQWLYLPALKRVKRISSSKKSGSFMGSEFSYEDLGAIEVEKFTHRHLRDEACGDLECAVLERIPLSEDSGYSRQVVWFDREELRTMQVQYFDRRDEHLKTMVVEDYAQYLDRFWRAGTVAMTNHLTGKSTVLNWTDYAFGTDLDEGDFTKTALKRAFGRGGGAASFRSQASPPVRADAASLGSAERSDREVSRPRVSLTRRASSRSAPSPIGRGRRGAPARQ